MKPEFWTSEQVAECSPLARLLFIGLWNFCDDAGRHPWRPRQIKMRIFPADDISASQVDGMLAELQENGLITAYEVDDDWYFFVTGWHHQKIDKRSAPQWPDPKSTHNSTRPPRGLTEGSEGEREGERERGRDLSEGGTETRAPTRTHEANGTLVSEQIKTLGLSPGLGSEDLELRAAETCVAMFNTELPELQTATKFIDWTAKRRAAWETMRRDMGKYAPNSEEDFREMFQAVRRSPLLMGHSTDFKAELTWLLNAERIEKLMEGGYE